MSNNTDASSLLGNTHIRKILESAQISINNDSLQSLSNCFMGLSGEQAEELHRTINNGATDTMKKLNLTDLKSTLTADIPDIRLQMENCMEFFKPSVDPALMETIKKAEEQISKSISNSMYDISNILRNYNESIDGILKNLPLSQLKKNQEEKVTAYKEWGELNWPILMEPPVGLFFSCPSNKTEADEILTPYCTDDAVMSAIDNLNKSSKIHKGILDEIKKSFSAGLYNAAAMLITSQIDGIFIARTPDRSNVGKGAIEKVNERLKASLQYSSWFIAGMWSNSLACLNILFKSCKQFVEEPNNINRNFLLHGMSTRNVSKIECSKLVFLLNNINYLLRQLGS